MALPLKSARLRILRLISHPLLRRPHNLPRCITQSYQTTTICRTDGVFRELTEARVQTPWIEALRKKQEQGEDPTEASGKSEVGKPEERDLSAKRMSDSYHSIIPLGQDPWLLDTYTNSSGDIRLGTIFMDLDALSGVIAYKHTGDAVTTVTAAFDRITINHPLTEICDLELSGQVTYATGRSSMEISLQVARAPKKDEKVKKEDILITCACTMVSLDPGTKKPVPISPVLAETEEEKRMFASGERNSAARKELSKISLLKHTPNDLESDLIHSMWLRELQYHDPNDPLRKPSNVVYMDTTKVSTAAIMQPQYRNRHHFMIFGGFLLKQTFELAFLCAASFAHARPTFVSLDPSTFQNPVPVGSVLYLSAHVVYTDPPLVAAEGEKTADSENKEGRRTSDLEKEGKRYTRVQVRVDSKVRDVEHGETKPTGQFNYTFNVERDVRVMPRTYQEFMMYVDARRRALKVAADIQDGESADAGQTERVTE
ncbi:Thioesterase/thiol ester dehydrase-isomerase [Patellaria atrata CBS 101060]|uniref:Thioesterase/thiol ester dehydrase-isomerase n=1 Tax=Patellaria atrata CBS 101060 TaxID=1346257 RepID=A0A9P4VTD8_9PEZI|nr:Thioesterase/thiol ester dehydrase-isomerase [Patellaria atrata CBS 101060]